MALESTFELLDLSIADQVSWTEFVFGNFGSYGDKTAIVSNSTFQLVMIFFSGYCL